MVMNSAPIAAKPSGPLQALVSGFYAFLGVLSCIAMVAAFVSIVLGVIAREFGFNWMGLDAYAGYAIAATLFLALPMTFQRGEHIRVTLLLDKVPAGVAKVLEYWALIAGVILTVYVTYYACHLVWISYITHDISPAIDATPMWIPQIAMALGSFGFALSLLDALLAKLQSRQFFISTDGEIARVE
jgi:TRAP-type C4-dicarboxylate transport system permease small subunit